MQGRTKTTDERDRTTGALVDPQAEYLLLFERLLSAISSMLIAATASEVQGRIEEALRSIVELFAVDRASLGERTPDGHHIFNRVSYGRPGVPLALALDTPHAAEVTPWFAQQLAHGRVVRIGRLSDLPEEASRERELAQRIGLVACLTVPILMQGRWHYAMSAVSFTSEINWPDHLIPRVRLLAEIFAHSYEHARMDRERERLLDAEREARSQAERAVRVRDDFLALAAHELRTPMTALQLTIEALSRSQQRAMHAQQAVTRELGSSRARRHLDTAQRQLAKLNVLVDQLLDVSRIAEGQLSLVRSEVDLSDVARTAIAKLEAPLRTSGSQLALDARGPVIGTWDRERLEHVVANLVANAIKYGAGAPIEVIVRTQGNAAQLVVRDHGIGIPIADQLRIFGRFERAVSSEHYGGLGLGLFVVQRVVEQLGGNVTCESMPGEGATFTVTLPRTEGCLPDAKRQA
jgi:signal transduction histidine kinase